MKTLYFLLLTGSLILLSIPAYGQNCQPSARAAARMWHYYKQNQGLAPKDRMIKSLQEWRDESKQARIPPQILRPNQGNKGKLWSQNRRTLISPPLNRSKMSFHFRLLQGKGKLGISLCSIDANGKATHIKSIVLNEETAAEGKTVQLNQMGGKILGVQLKNYAATGGVNYEIVLK